MSKLHIEWVRTGTASAYEVDDFDGSPTVSVPLEGFLRSIGVHLLPPLGLPTTLRVDLVYTDRMRIGDAHFDLALFGIHLDGPALAIYEDVEGWTQEIDDAYVAPYQARLMAFLRTFLERDDLPTEFEHLAVSDDLSELRIVFPGVWNEQAE